MPEGERNLALESGEVRRIVRLMIVAKRLLGILFLLLSAGLTFSAIVTPIKGYITYSLVFLAKGIDCLRNKQEKS